MLVAGSAPKVRWICSGVPSPAADALADADSALRSTGTVASSPAAPAVLSTCRREGRQDPAGSSGTLG
jgi:hypothetical protein